MQKRAIKRNYAKDLKVAKNVAQTGKKAMGFTSKAAKMITALIRKNPVFLVKTGLLLLIIFLILSMFSMYMGMFSGTSSFVDTVSYAAEFEDITGGISFSVSEGLDSRKPGGQDKIVGLIHNTVNDIISVQTSQKVRDVNAAKVARGERLNPSNPPYGFTYDKEKKKLVPDPESAEIVKQIFEMYTKQGLGKNDIAANLFEAKIPIPSEYKNKVEKPRCKWRGEVVTKILTRLEYAGHTVHRYSYVACHKSGRRVYLPPEDRQITYNTHEAIIDPRTFEAAQSLHSKRRRPSSQNLDDLPVYAGFLLCADCGKPLHANRDRNKPVTSHCFVCSSYRRSVKAHGYLCTSHTIPFHRLEKALIKEITLVLNAAVNHENRLLQKILDRVNIEEQSEALNKAKELADANQRLTELKTILTTAYNEKVLGKLSEERYEAITDEFEVEQDELRNLIEKLEKENQPPRDIAANVKFFISLAKKYHLNKDITFSSCRQKNGSPGVRASPAGCVAEPHKSNHL